jgi:hypothetical protein
MESGTQRDGKTVIVAKVPHVFKTGENDIEHLNENFAVAFVKLTALEQRISALEARTGGK